jgi:hypothetical protein
VLAENSGFFLPSRCMDKSRAKCQNVVKNCVGYAAFQFSCRCTLFGYTIAALDLQFVGGADTEANSNFSEIEYRALMDLRPINSLYFNFNLLILFTISIYI